MTRVDTFIIAAFAGSLLLYKFFGMTAAVTTASMAAGGAFGLVGALISAKQSWGQYLGWPLLFGGSAGIVGFVASTTLLYVAKAMGQDYLTFITN
jgi:hypothetical protein